MSNGSRQAGQSPVAVNEPAAPEKEPSFRFSFVVSTVGRPTELRRLFASLAEQGESDVEVVVVEQNDDRPSELLLTGEAWPFSTTYVHMSERGLSKGRNAGLQACRGRVIAFPDDNCWYEPGALARVREILDARPELAGVSIRQVDEGGADALGRWHSRPGLITRWNLAHRVTSSSLFLRRELVERVGEFNEELGLGAGTPWQAGEENDFVSRAVSSGAKIHYEPVGLVKQDDWRNDDVEPIQKVYSYNCGFGRSMRINAYPSWFMAYYVFRQVGAYVTAAARMDGRGRRMARAAIRGRLRGWRGRPDEKGDTPDDAVNPFEPLDAVRRLDPRRRYVDYIHLSDLLAALRAHAEEIEGHVVDYGSGIAPYKPLFDRATSYNAADFAVNTFADTVLDPDGRLPLDDRTADSVLSIQVLEHVPEPAVYIRECLRVLRPGGKLLLTTHGMWEFHPVPTDLQRWTHQGLTRLIEAEGFDVASVVAISDGVRGAIQLLQLSIEHRKLPYVVRGVVRVLLNTIADLRLSRQERVRPAADSLMPIAYLVVARKPAT